MPKRFHSAEAKHNPLGEELYASHDERRALEARDGAMLNEDHSAIANMPQDVKMHEYPKIHGWTPEDLDDTERGIEHQVGEDNAKKMQHFMPKKV